jgi:hypothetical protein
VCDPDAQVMRSGGAAPSDKQASSLTLRVDIAYLYTDLTAPVCLDSSVALTLAE